MATPFEQDCAKKRDGVLLFHDEKARKGTCVCGIRRIHHWEEVEMGRCSGFRSMNLRQWADWIGVDYSEPGGKR